MGRSVEPGAGLGQDAGAHAEELQRVRGPGDSRRVVPGSHGHLGQGGRGRQLIALASRRQGDVGLGAARVGGADQEFRAAPVQHRPGRQMGGDAGQVEGGLELQVGSIDRHTKQRALAHFRLGVGRGLRPYREDDIDPRLRRLPRRSGRSLIGHGDHRSQEGLWPAHQLADLARHLLSPVCAVRQ